MKLAERFGSIAAVLSVDSEVTIPVRDLRDWIAEDGSLIPVDPPTDSNPDRWLTVDECAALLGVSPRWCYDHPRELGQKKLSPRCVRFSEKTITRYMARLA